LKTFLLADALFIVTNCKTTSGGESRLGGFGWQSRFLLFYLGFAARVKQPMAMEYLDVIFALAGRRVF
jgi:hypothetical protein